MEFTALWTEHGFWCIEADGVRAFLFIGTDKALLIDTARGGDLLSFCRTITDKPIMVATTHADGDHTGADEQFTEQYVHPCEFDYYSSKKTMPAHVKPIWEGDVIDIGRFEFEVILIPGHTPGSVMYLERNKRFAIGGDSIQSGPIFMFGPGRNFNSYIASMEKLLGLADKMDVIYSSHNELMIHPDIIPDLIEGANVYLSGEAEYTDAPSHLPENVKQFNIGRAHFYAYL